MTYVLIIFVYITFGGGAGVTMVPGYATKEACQSAGKEVVAGWGAASFRCITGPSS